jgi:hypothetical protein
VLPICLGLGVQPAKATIQLPDGAGERDMALQQLKELCQDYSLTYVQDANGHWIVKVGAKTSEVDKTPVGCRLVMRLSSHARTVRINFDGSIIAGAEVGDTPADGQTTPGGDPGGKPGPGTNAVVTVNPNIVPPGSTTPGGKHASGVAGYDAGGKLIRRSPRVIILGHELIHALHDMDGTRTNDPEGQTIDHAGPGPNDITENDLNAEQTKAGGFVPPLGRRSGHCGEMV